ncbi:hypothetical protein H0H93_013172 [Arthromyces matolae]|nr:hypothetical protein H0H93_013172 [Arthromyces matolae]
MANNRYVGIVDGAPVGVTDIRSASLWRISNQLENPGNPTATIIAAQTHTAFTLNSNGVVTLATNYDRENQLWIFDRVFSTGDEE